MPKSDKKGKNGSLTVKTKKNKKQTSVLKNKCKEEQLSMTNQDGRKQYDREFLLQLQNAPQSLIKPANLPDIPDIIIKKIEWVPRREYNSAKTMEHTHQEHWAIMAQNLIKFKTEEEKLLDSDWDDRKKMQTGDKSGEKPSKNDTSHMEEIFKEIKQFPLHTYSSPPAVFYNLAAQQQKRSLMIAGMIGQGQQPTKKRERSLLPIIDPASGKDISLGILQAQSTIPLSDTLASHSILVNGHESTQPEASTPVSGKENQDINEGYKTPDKSGTMDSTPTTPIVDNGVVPKMNVRTEDVYSSDAYIAVRQEKIYKQKAVLKFKEVSEQSPPVSIGGEKLYDRDFLLQQHNAPESVLHSLDLPDIADVIIEKSQCLPQRDEKNSIDQIHQEVAQQEGKKSILIENVSEFTDKNYSILNESVKGEEQPLSSLPCRSSPGNFAHGLIHPQHSSSSRKLPVESLERQMQNLEKEKLQLEIELIKLKHKKLMEEMEVLKLQKDLLKMKLIS